MNVPTSEFERGGLAGLGVQVDGHLPGVDHSARPVAIGCANVSRNTLTTTSCNDENRRRGCADIRVLEEMAHRI